MKNFLCRKAISRALKRRSPDRIPLSGNAAKLRGRNYFTANLGDERDRWRFLALEEEENGFSGLWFTDADGEEPQKASIPFNQLSKFNLNIVFYFSDQQFDFTSAGHFLLSQFLRIHWFVLLKERLAQFAFNKRRLVRSDRMDVLRQILESTVADRGFSTGPIDIMTRRYGHRWMSHPANDQICRYYEIVLKSLVASNDLEYDRTALAYRMQPKALIALSKQELDDRRHVQLLRQQRTLSWLTGLLVVVGALQLMSMLAPLLKIGQ